MFALYRNILSWCFVLCTSTLFAQVGGLTLLPLGSNPALLNVEPAKPNLRKSPLAVVTLPFFDDFSYEGPYPDTDWWLDNTVFVNSTMAGNNAPSVGVATFDAINARGAAYVANPLDTQTGSADTLTSNYIALDTYTAADSLILSFYLQPKGLCYAPAPTDSVVLEFRNSAGVWKRVRQMTYTVVGGTNLNDTLPPFVYYAFKITEPEYLYGNFQFRFRNYTRLSGIYAAWHLDYVRLDRNRRLSDATFSDIAFTQRPKSALKNYSALPWRQVKANLQGEIRDSLVLSLRSQFGQTNNITDSRASVKDVSNNGNLFTPFVILTENIAANALVSRSVPLADRSAYLAALGTGLQDRESVILETQYSFSNVGQIPESNARAARRNDTVTLRTNMSDYFAYDDGTAEFLITPNPAAGNTIAVRFRANVADTLRGVRLMFPHVKKDQTITKFNLKIWKDSLVNNTISRPIFTQRNLVPFFPDRLVDTLQGFSTYRLEDSAGNPTFLPIPAGDFFVGIELTDAIEIPIGLDRGNFEASPNVRFLNADGTWGRLNINVGAPMIRAITGKTTPRRLGTTNLAVETATWHVFPNPAHDRLQIENWSKNFTEQPQSILIFNALGQIVQTQTIENISASLDISALPAGVYFLQIDAKNAAIKPFRHTFVKQ